jgi:hypothetical protein
MGMAEPDDAESGALWLVPPAIYVSRTKWAWIRVREALWENAATAIAVVAAAYFGVREELKAALVTLVIAAGVTTVRYLYYFLRARSVQMAERLTLVERQLDRALRQIADLTAEAPPLVVDFDIVWAPAALAAGSKHRLVQLDYSDPDPPLTVRTSEEASTPDYRMFGRPTYCRCTVRNHSGKRLLGGVLGFDVMFFQGEEPTKDSILYRQPVQVRFPFMPLDDAFEFDLFNQTGLAVGLGLPKTALVELEGESHQRVARVHASQASLFPGAAILILPAYNLPGSISPQ